MINLAVINIKEVIKYLVKVTIIITVVVALTRYFSTYSSSIVNKISDKTFLNCLDETIPGIKTMNKKEYKTDEVEPLKMMLSMEMPMIDSIKKENLQMAKEENIKIEEKNDNIEEEPQVEKIEEVKTGIETEVLENNIGYIYISDFDGGCADEFTEKYKELEKQGIKKLIIDIRNNGGGIVDEAIDILKLITNKGDKLLITKDKKENEKISKNDKNPIIEMPIVVLTNSYSASASEILTGALKDNEKATIVGTTTYGKGVIQTIHQLTDGSGLKITTNEYYTPNYNKINKIGIEPNIEVELPKEYENALVIPKDKDTQLQKAIELLK